MKFNLQFDLDAEHKKKLGMIVGGSILIILIVYLLLPGGGNATQNIAYTYPVYMKTSSTTSVAEYSLIGKNTIALPTFDDGEYWIKITYPGLGVVDVFEYNGSYSLWASMDSTIFTTDGKTGVPGQPVTSAMLWVNRIVSSATLTVSSGVNYYVVSGYTFSVDGSFVYVWWTDSYYTVSMTYEPFSTVFRKPMVWITFTTQTSTSKSSTVKK